MTLSDAMRVLRHREHFPHVDFALSLVGVEFSTANPATPSRSATTHDRRENLDFLDDPVVAESRVDGWAEVDWTQAPGPSWRTDDDGPEPTGGDADGGGPVRPSGHRPGRPAPPPSQKIIASVLASTGSRPPEEAVLPSYTSIAHHAAPADAGFGTDIAVGTRTLRSDLRAAVRVPRRSRTPDVHAVVDLIARARPLVELPTLDRPSPPLLVRVLVDTRLRTGPYAHDVDHLIGEARRTLGDERTELFSFCGSPDQGCGPGPIWTWMPLDAHPAAAATLLLRPGHRTHSEDEERIERSAQRHRQAGLRFFQVVIGSPPAVGIRPRVDEWHIRD